MSVEARALLEFIDDAPSPFHAVQAVRQLLGSAFSELRECQPFQLTSGGAHLVTRNDSSLIAFRLPQAVTDETRIVIIGAHTDSPTLKVKPRASVLKEGYRQFGVEVYGGPLLASWTDRDLGLAGRLLFKGANALEPRSVLYRSAHPLCRIPQLAIHLNRAVNDDGLVLNKQTHLAPVWALGDDAGEHDALLQWLCADLGEAIDDLCGWDLVLFDQQPSALGGANGEFIFAPRLDNLAMCFSATQALSQTSDPSPHLRLIALFDNEEVGSQSHRGAGGNFLEQVLERVLINLDLPRERRFQLINRSLFVSADMAHAVHPNYVDKHEPAHHPLINRGVVLKSNAQERYATTGFSAAVIRRLAQDLEIPLQEFVSRTDLACGSTIGPMTAARLGMPTVDLGNAMLSMHSVREMAGSGDVAHATALFSGLFGLS